MIPSRTSYWLIQHVWVFYFLAALAACIFLFGLGIHISVWIRGIKRQKIPLSWHGISNLLFDGLFGRRIFRGDIAAGTMHILILWGFLGLFIGTVLISADYWLFHFLKGPVYVWYSICLEVAGLMLIIGIVWAMIRRYLQRVQRLENRFEDFFVIFLLFLVGLSGFVVEGIRLAVQRPEWGTWSFAGYWMSLLFTQSKNAQSAYPYVWWIHALLSLGLIAYIPFCKLFHILAAPTSIYLENQSPQAIPIETRSPNDEVFSYKDMIFFDACTRCGRCWRCALQLVPENPFLLEILSSGPGIIV